MKIFTLNCHPGMSWTVRVVVHRSRAALRRHRARLEHVREIKAIEGFFHEWPASRWGDRCIIGEIHLFRRGSQATVIHECAHAAVWLACVLKLDLNHQWGNETFVQTVEHITDGTLHGIKLR